MSSMPENVNYGDPNAYPTNFFTEAAMEQQKTEQNTKKNNQQSDQIDQKNTTEKYSLNKDNTFKFLNIKATTILTVATAVAIGFTLNNLITSLVHNVIQPILFKIIVYIDKNDFLPITAGLREKNLPLDFSKFFGSMLIVKLVIILMYFMNKYEFFLF
jgi:large-conductance mechanosensitive channel